MLLKKIVYTLLLGFCSLLARSQQPDSMVNPLLSSGPDPYSFYKDGYYYYTHTLGTRVGLWKTPTLAMLDSAAFRVIFKPPANTPYSKDLWAPEVMFLRGKWYAYFAADDGSNAHHRLYVLENSSADPMQGEWVMKGKLTDNTDKWAIDADVFEYNGKLYLLWSGWEGDTNGEQDIYIAEMKNPWTVGSERVRISRPEYDWEKIGDLKTETPPHINVNEGPQALLHNQDLFVIYSASACWTDNYALGELRLKPGANPLKAESWSKSSVPVFKQLPASHVYATGHNSFFKSPNGREDWILYHANSNPEDGCGNKRSPHAQPFTWNKDGTPEFGVPVKEGVRIAAPGTN